MIKPYSETVSASGSLQATSSTTAGTAIAEIPAASLPSGLYLVKAYTWMSAATTPAAMDLLQIQRDTTAICKIQHQAAVVNSLAYDHKSGIEAFVRVNGNQKIGVGYNGPTTGSETQTHRVVVNATKVSD